MASHRTARFGLGPRQLALAGAVACALAAAAYAVGTSESPVGLSSVNPSGAATDSARDTGTQSSDMQFPTERNWADKLRRAPIEVKSGGSLFDSTSWTPPPPPPTVAKSAPSVPPFPFQYMGKLVIEGDETTFYLTRGDEIHSVKAGTVFAGNYRVETIAADSLEVTYLPLDKKQHVAFSSIVSSPAQYVPPPAQSGRSMFGMEGRNTPVTLARVTAPQAGDEASRSTGAENSPSSASVQPAGPAIASTAMSTVAAAATPAPATGIGSASGQSATTSLVNISDIVIPPPTISQAPMFPAAINPMTITPAVGTQAQSPTPEK